MTEMVTEKQSETQKQGEFRTFKQALSGCESPFQLCAMSPPEDLVESDFSRPQTLTPWYPSTLHPQCQRQGMLGSEPGGEVA